MSKIIQKRVIVWFIAIIMSIFVSGCGGGGSSGSPILGQGANTGALTVTSTDPLANATNVALNKSVSAIFSETLNPTTVTTSSFHLVTTSTNVAVTGTLSYSGNTMLFNPDVAFAPSTQYTATITTDVKDLAGNALAVAKVWNFTTGLAPDTTAPTVTSTDPLANATNVALNKSVSAIFSETLNPTTVTTSSFHLVTTSTNVAVTGTLSYSGNTMLFNPDVAFAPSTQYTATITTDVKDLAGNALAVAKVWNFTTGLVDFGSAKTFAIASTAGVTNFGATTIDGDVVLNLTYTCNGVALTADGTFTGCAGDAPTLVSPYKVISPIYQPTITAQSITDDLRAAYLEIKGKTGETLIVAPTTLGTGSTGQNTFAPGVYTTGSSSSIGITGDLTLNGGPNDTFVFKSWSTIDMAVGARIILTGGAKASNVYWLAGSSATLLGNSVWNGNLLAYASISMGTGATSCGRLFAGASTAGAFTFLANKVAVPGNTVALPGCE